MFAESVQFVWSMCVCSFVTESFVTMPLLLQNVTFRRFVNCSVMCNFVFCHSATDVLIDSSLLSTMS